jgi:hypothetical protein
VIILKSGCSYQPPLSVETDRTMGLVVLLDDANLVFVGKRKIVTGFPDQDGIVPHVKLLCPFWRRSL